MPKRALTLRPPLSIPPLENGDELSRTEFERRYDAMPQVKKAELIEGIVYMASPLRFKSHGKPNAYIIGWLATYEAATPGVELGDNATVLREGEYIQLQANAEGIICSEVFPGLCLNTSALLTGNLAKVLGVVQEGLATDEHNNFVEQLSELTAPERGARL